MAYVPDAELDALQRWLLNLADSALQLEKVLHGLRGDAQDALEGKESAETIDHPADPNQALRDSVNGA